MAPHPSLLLVPLILSLLPPIHSIGVNWGTDSSHPLLPPLTTNLLKLNSFTRVKLSDANPLVLRSLSGSGVYVTVGIPNSMLRVLNGSAKAARSWVHENVTRYSGSGVKIEYVAVGDEPFLQSYGEQFHPFVLGATINIQNALTAANSANKVKVVVPCSSDTFGSESGLPSKGHFRSDINKTMIELLSFLNKYRSPFVVTISPFLSHLQNKNISLDFALFKENARPVNDSKNTYKNSFDLSYDTLVIALKSIGFPDMDIIVWKIGWPTDGYPNATSSLAQTFMQGLTQHLHSKAGSPLRPRNPPIEVYLFTLLDEDQRSIDTGSFERHWGIFTFDGQAKYQVDFGQGSKKLTNAVNVDYLASRWCVVNNNRDLSNASAKAIEACSAADCSSLSTGGSCFNISWPGNISYAFNSYYQQHDQRAESCDFGGLGLITTVDPSRDSCRFSVELQNSRSVSLTWFILVHLVLLLVTIGPLW